MYRQYENPRTLQERLDALYARRAASIDEDEIMNLDEDIGELKDRIRFAWDDEEYDCD